MAKIVCIHKKMSSFILQGMAPGTEVYYLSSDYEGYRYLCERHAHLIFKRLDDLFHSTFNRIKADLRVMIAKLGARYNNVVWWGSQQASLNTASTPLAKNITYFFCAQKIIAKGQDVVFILESNALARSIGSFAHFHGHSYRYLGARFMGTYAFLRRLACYLVQIVRFLVEMGLAMAARGIVPPLPAQKDAQIKRVVLRSWLTDGVFDKDGKFKERNFGILPQWLKDKGYEVWILPMFFNFSMSSFRFCQAVKRQQQLFIIPWDHLHIQDYWDVLCQSLAVIFLRVDNVFVDNHDVSIFVKESLQENGFDHGLSILNLSLPLLRRLKDRGYKIDAFYYPYEGNAPEKIFLIGCHKYFPQSAVAGFQHTVFFDEQLAFYLALGEDRHHPLPDKIICSGPIYEDLYMRSGISQKQLASGPNLRFGAIYKSKPLPYLDSGRVHNFLIPTTFSYDLDFELFAKIAPAISRLSDCRVWIRKHPLMSRKRLVDFLEEIGLVNFDFADSGSLQEWLPKMQAMFSSGSSVTILEAVAAGVPVIRVVPENTFFYDPFAWPQYPLNPAYDTTDIVKDIEYIDKVRYAQDSIFSRIAVDVTREYFTQPSEENLKVFL